MHIFNIFKQSNLTQLRQVISSSPFAILICNLETGIEATHIPMYLVEDEEGVLVLKGHVAKANKICKEVEDKASVLVIFQGPDSYISPNYYPTKKEHGKVVPTWNYISVHIKGEICFKNDVEWKLDMLESLTNKFESEEVRPWKISDAPNDFITNQLGGIVGLEIAILSIDGQWKLSQNQPEINQQGVIDGLSQSKRKGAKTVSEAMKTLINQK